MNKIREVFGFVLILILLILVPFSQLNAGPPVPVASGQNELVDPQTSSNDEEQAQKNKRKPKFKAGELLVKFKSQAIATERKLLAEEKKQANKNKNAKKDKSEKEYSHRIPSHALDMLNQRGKSKVDKLIRRKNIKPGSNMARWRSVKLPKDMTEDEAIELFKNDPNVEYVEPNYIVELNVIPDDVLYNYLWGMDRINAPAAWDSETGYWPIVVGVIDTGVDYTHPDLVNNMWINPGEIAGNGVDDDGNGYIDDVYGYDFANDDGDPYDDFAHGTHVAGTIGAVGNNAQGVVGINWTTQIMALKFIGSNGFGTTLGAIQAIDYAVSMGVKLTNNSWGCLGCYSQAMEDSIQAANDAGMLFVAAAGNYRRGGHNVDITPFYPANFDVPNVVSVAASSIFGGKAYFSNYGQQTVDLAAPGLGILSTIPDWLCEIWESKGYPCMFPGYGWFSGTSMAAPHVTGALALLLASEPELSADELKKRLLENVSVEPAFARYTNTSGHLDLVKLLTNSPTAPDYKLSMSPQYYELNSGETGKADVVIDSGENYSGSLTLSAVSPNALISVNLSENILDILPGEQGIVTLTAITSAELPQGNYPIEVIVSNDIGQSRSRIVTLKVEGPMLSIVPSPISPYITPGERAVVSLDITSVNGYSGDVSISASSMVPDATEYFSSQSDNFPLGSSITILPSNITLSAGETQTVTMFVDTTLETPAGYDYLLYLNFQGQYSSWTPTMTIGIWYPGIDLINTEIWLDTDIKYNVGDRYIASITEANYGVEDAPAHESAFYISTDDVINTNDTPLFSLDIPLLKKRGEEYHVHPSFLIPNVPPGIYYVGVVSDHLSQVVESNENNNVSTDIYEIEITNGSDLVFSEFILEPNSVVTPGGFIPYSATITNQGNSPVRGSEFFVGLYVSTDENITTADKLIKEVRFNSVLFDDEILAPGESRVVYGGAGLNGYDIQSGTYYFGGIVDHTDKEREANETNNTAVAGTFTFLQDVDLTPVAVSLSKSQVSQLETFSVSTTISNTGSTDAVDVTVHYYLSDDAVITEEDQLLTTSTIPLVPASGSVVNTPLNNQRIGAGSALGLYYVGVIIDQGDNISERDENNNISLAESIELINNVDPAVSAVSYSSVFVEPGDTVLVSYTLSNLGTTSFTKWVKPACKIHLSADTVYDETDVLLEVCDVPYLAGGESADYIKNVTLSATLGAGNYHILVVLNGPADDLNSANNIMSGHQMESGASFDLSISDVSSSSQTLFSGIPFNLNFTLNNSGSSLVPNVDTTFYLSTDALLSADDVFITDVTSAGLQAASSVSVTASSVSIPSGVSSGDYYLIAATDQLDLLPESNETDNSAVGALISVTNSSDLMIESLSSDLSSLAAGESLTINGMVKNVGATDVASGYTIGVYISGNPVFNSNAVYLGEWQGTTILTSGASENVSLTVKLPGSKDYIGDRYIHVVADSQEIIAETDETNNGASIAVNLVTEFDLIIGNVSVEESFARAGDTIKIDSSVSNIGPSTVYNSVYDYNKTNHKVGLYLSTDTEITSSDLAIGIWEHRYGIAGGGTISKTVSITLNSDVPPGDYFIGAIADAGNRRPETDETNNGLAGNRISIGIADADLSVTTVEADVTTIDAGGSFTVSSTVKSDGLFVVPKGNKVAIYLSTDSVIDDSDRILNGWATKTELFNGASESYDVNVTIPSTLAPGIYYVGAMVDLGDAISETDESNNSLASLTQIEVVDGVADSDLLISRVSSNLSNVSGGSTLTINSSLRNDGPLATLPGQLVGLYFSSDPVISADDTLVGTWTSSISLASGETENRSVLVTVPNSLNTGSYYVGAIADVNNTVSESDEANNMAVAVSMVNVLVDVDVIVSNVSAASTTITAGESYIVATTVQNSGSSTVAAGMEVGIYLSSDSNIDMNDILIASWITSSSLEAGASESQDVTITELNNAAAGSFYIGAIADVKGSVAETEENNNSNLSTSIVLVNGSDLIMTTWTSAPQAEQGGSFSASYTITNQGNTGTKTTYSQHWGWSKFGASVYLSIDEVLSSDDSRLTGVASVDNPSAVLPGNSFSNDLTLIVPQGVAPGLYNMLVVSKQALNEVNGTNNVLSLPFLVESGDFDLSMQSVAIDKTTVFAGDSLTISSAVTNSGSIAIDPGHVVGLYLSTNKSIEHTDTFLGSWTTTLALASGESESQDVVLTLSSVLDAGDYYIGAIADVDDSVLETNEYNNSITAMSQLTVAEDVDLQLTALSATPEGIVPAGGELNISTTITNTGISEVPSGHVTHFYLSTDTVIDTADAFIGSWAAGNALADGATESRDISIDIPQSILPGEYYIGAIIDATDIVAEGNEGNNEQVIPVSISIQSCMVDGVEVDCLTGLPIEKSRSMLCPERTLEPIYGLYCDFKLKNLRFTAYKLHHSWGGAGFDAGTTFTTAYQLNDNSDVVGSAITSAGDLHAVRMNVGDGNFTNLYFTDLGQPGLSSEARAANNLLTYVGKAQLDAANPGQQEVIWQSQLGMPYSLSALGTEGGVATGIAFNSFYTEYVSGYSVWKNDPVNSDGLEHGFIWSFDGQNQSITRIGDYGQANRALAINDSQIAVGYLLNSDGTHQAYRSFLGAITPLYDGGGNNSQALSVNNNVSHKTVGYAFDLSGNRHAVLWQNEAMYSLPPLSGAVVDSYANAINDVGDIVGQSDNRAVFWRNGGAYNLNRLLENDVNVVFTEALDVNRRGRILVKGDDEAYYVLIPSVESEPQPGVDLRITEVNGNPTQLETGDTLTISSTVTNSGTTSVAPGHVVGVYLSTDPIIDQTDTLVSSWATTLSLVDNVTETRELSIMVPASLGTGNYYIGAIADYENTITEINENNNSLANVVAISVGSDSDLVMQAVSSMATTAASGDQIVISSTAINNGTSIVAAGHEVGLFLSSDTTYDVNDIYLGSWMPTDLNAQESQSQDVTITIPITTLAGDYHVIAFADYNYNVIESDETNNVLASSATIKVTTDVDFTVTSISSFSNTIDAGGTLVFSTAVLNSGDSMAAPGHEVGLYLSSDTTIDSNDIKVGSWSVPWYLPSGEEQGDNVLVTIPAGTAGGEYYIGAIADDGNAVTETDETNNSLSSINLISVTRDVDFSVTGLSSNISNVSVGESLTLTSTVTNTGISAVESGTAVGFYLSSDGIIDVANDTYLGSWAISQAISSGATETSSNVFVVPETMTAGDYYIGAIVDFNDFVAESNENNNIYLDSQINVMAGNVDLTLSNLNAPASASPGSTISVTYTVTNAGTESLSQWWWAPQAVFLSTDATIEPYSSDVQLLSSPTYHGDLPPGSSLNRNLSVTIPADQTPGTYYIGVYVDDWLYIPESNENNNVMALPIEVGAVQEYNLTTTAVSTSVANVAVGENISISSTVQNTGESLITSGKTVGLYLSSDNVIDISDTQIGSWSTTLSLASGSSESSTIVATVPASAASGSYYVGAIADVSNVLSETNENDNALAAVSSISVLSNIDLIITALSGDLNSVEAGSGFTLSSTVQNSGVSSVTSGFDVGFYLSADDVINAANDTFIGSWTNTSILGSGVSQSNSSVVTVPATLESGVYYIGAIVDSNAAVAESNETNNAYVGSTVTVVANSIDPDLTITNLNANSQAGVSGTIDVSLQVENQGGTDASSTFYTRYYLSSDAEITTADTYLGVFNGLSGGLVAGGSQSYSRTLTIPAGTIPGNYYVGVITDVWGSVVESNESNNAAASAITILSNDIDVLLTSVSSATSSLPAGDSMSISAAVTNPGTNSIASGETVISYYLSTDSDITTQDILLGNRTLGTLSSGGNVNIAMSTAVNVTPGTYYLGVIVDVDNQLAETDESNNVLAGGALTVVSGRDLVVTNLLAPIQAGVGGTIDVSLQVENQGGTDASSTFYTRYYLSSDAEITTADTYLGVFNGLSGGLVAGGSQSYSRTLTIPAGTIPGNYYVGVITDVWGSVVESDENNNVAASPISIQ